MNSEEKKHTHPLEKQFTFGFNPNSSNKRQANTIMNSSIEEDKENEESNRLSSELPTTDVLL